MPAPTSQPVREIDAASTPGRYTTALLDFTLWRSALARRVVYTLACGEVRWALNALYRDERRLDRVTGAA